NLTIYFCKSCHGILYNAKIEGHTLTDYLGGMMMAENAYIKLVPSSAKQTVTIEDVKELFRYYKNITGKTGKQLDWQFGETAFPYVIRETDAGQGKWFYLHSDHDRYNAILIGIDHETLRNENGEERKQTYIQITLPEQSTYGD